MRRVYYMSMLAVCALVLLAARTSQAQSNTRRGEPNNLGSGYYVVDSDDDAPTPWRPNYFFMDTTYQSFTWTRIGSGAQQFYPPGYFFYNPNGLGNIKTMDTSDEAMAGPISMGLGHSFSFYRGNYDSCYISSNGFIGFSSYAQATAGNPPAYTNGSNVDLKNSPGSAPPAIIAALWADLELHNPGDTSKVYVRTAPSLDTFMVNYYNLRLKNSGGNNNFFPPGFGAQGADRIYMKKLQIVLANTDSSIQINYGPFSGAANYFPPVLAWALFQQNVSIGVVDSTRSLATSVLYRNRWDANVNITCRSCNKKLRQAGQYAIKFKRWHNIVRAIAVTYPPRNYEICLGTSVTPRGTFQNVDSVAETFKVRYTIRNAVTGVAVYGRDVALVGVLPGQQVDTSFPPYSTNPNILSEVGTFRACGIATTYDTANVNIGDMWPFDDTICIRIFGVKRLAQPFVDYSNQYSRTSSGDIPDQQKWISVGASVIDGEDATWDPPPPRDLDGPGIGPDQMKSPVIRMDRTDIDGNVYVSQGQPSGDTLISFPINLQGFTSAGLTFDYMRTGRTRYPWLWNATVMLGPENTIVSPAGAVIRPGDSMAIEFKKPTAPACNPLGSDWNRIGAIDGGYDFEFKKYFVKLNNLPNNVNYFTTDFRFRLRLLAKDDYPSPPNNPPPSDDDDPWYIDNAQLFVPRKPEIEVMWVRCVNPYTKIPASQAVSLPIYVKVANNSTDVSIAFPITVQVLDPGLNTKYMQTITVASLAGGTDSVLQMPNWNAQNAGTGNGAKYTIHAWLSQSGYDSHELDNGTYTLFYLNVEDPSTGGLTQEFAYDHAGIIPGYGTGNDIPNIPNAPTNFAGITGDGIGFTDFNGSFATKFRLLTKDTIYGVRVYFASANQSPDAIRISLLNGDPRSCVPRDTVAQANVQSTFTDSRKGAYFDQFWPYYFPKPIVLAGGADAPKTQGVYWMSVSQLGLNNMMMGGDLSRGGGVITVYDPQVPQVPPLYKSRYGTQYAPEPDGNNGDISCVWALEQTAGSGNWSQWTPSSGYWPTMIEAGHPLAHTTDFFPYAGQFNPVPVMIEGGSYTPMIRPLVSRSALLPIDLVYLKGEEKNGQALLTWATSKEVNNMGFHIERRTAGSNDLWEKVGFTNSKNPNSSTTIGYAFIDKNVQPGTYEYHLISEDLNGTQHGSNTVDITIPVPNRYSLEQNYPNPFNPSTDITFNLPVSGLTQLVIYNALGEVVRTMINGQVEAGTVTVRWDGKDANNTLQPSGSYMYKLTSGQFTAFRKMTLAK